MRAVFRKHWASMNPTTIIKEEGKWVTLINLDDFPVSEEVIGTWVNQVNELAGYPVTLWRGLTFDIKSVGGIIIRSRVMGNELHGFLVPHGAMKNRLINNSRECGLPIVFLAKYEDIRDKTSITEILGFRVDFSLSDHFRDLNAEQNRKPKSKTHRNPLSSTWTAI